MHKQLYLAWIQAQSALSPPDSDSLQISGENISSIAQLVIQRRLSCGYQKQKEKKSGGGEGEAKENKPYGIPQESSHWGDSSLEPPDGTTVKWCS